MPFALLIIGIIFIVAAVRNMQDALIALVKGDFTGTGNFFYWIVALILVGAIGYIPKAKPISDGLLVLILLALVLSSGNPSKPGGGVFQQLTAALGSTTNSAGSATTAAANAVTGGN